MTPTATPFIIHPWFGEMTRCPRKLITPDTWRIAAYHNHYQAGFLPGSGGAGEQDHRVMAGIGIIAETVADVRAQQREDLKDGR